MTIMEHLPPNGWSDVARTRDIEHLRDHFDTVFAGAFIGLFSLIATKL